ncbi:hypothetical protein SSX86_020022 [Deinandra increscens subsp. villosa]|uniref:TIR domain-containing protein n=1 Tax=Deinandra increscens subsp. villosa TaxID=3103831 RepID=A0AAP0GWA3_9ASTR
MASSSRSWKYDVFISFRGEDTRKTFVDHLFNALKQQGISAYKDDTDLQRGESIGQSLLKAIEESHIALIIFSKNYANSSWCLDELAYIMKCRDDRSQIVIPIFYNIDPSDVRKQKGEFGQGFSIHKQENIGKVEPWRKALVDASNIAGWELNNIANWHESEGIGKIVDVISKQLYSSKSYVDKSLIGMGARLENMESRLKVGTGGVLMVGIWGIGGSGKTTLATYVYMSIHQHFDCHCIIENIREESSNITGLKALQEKMLSSVLRTNMGVQSVMHGKHEIKNRLSGRKVLIVLDDVDDHEQLKALAGSHDWFGDGSRIIITTRDEHLLNKHKVDDVSRVLLLSNDEAFHLFYKHAYNENEPVENYSMLSSCVVSYAGGLPLALIILGSFLYDKNKSEWMSTLARLKEIPESGIMEKLKISYDGLKLVEKELFLDIACFYTRNMHIEMAMEILDACGFYPSIGIKVLRQKGLITTLDGKFDMHDLIREMAFYIVRGDHPNNLEEHSRIWQSKKIEEMCSGNAEMKAKENYKTEAILFHSWELSLNVSNFCKHLSNMKKLRFISVHGDGDGCSEGPTFLSDELRFIQMSCNLERSLPSNFQGKKLVVLKLDHSLQEELWKGKQDLPNLRTIELFRLYNLMETPDFDGLPNLERFMLSGSPHLKEIHPSIGRLERLVCLIIQGCSRLRRCPPVTRSKKLETLVLSGCSQLFNVLEIQQNMGKFRYIDLEKSGNEFVPGLSPIGPRSVLKVAHRPSGHGFKFQIGQGDVTRMSRFSVHKRNQHNQHQTNFFVTFLRCCSNLDRNTEDLTNVEEPSLLQNNIINHIGFQSFHRGLVKLDLRWCNLVDENLCSDVLELSCLQELDLRGNEFSQINFALLQLPRLKWLDVSSCKKLIKLSELPSSIAVLIAENCCSLESLGDVSHCKWLWKVSLMGENKLGLLSGDILLDSMFQGNGVEEHFISFALTDLELWKGFVRRGDWKKRFILRLPSNWHNEYCGFIITTVSRAFTTRITMNINQELDEDCHSELLQESNEIQEPDHHSTIYVGYVSFTSLRHTAWLKPENKMISFSLSSENECSIVVELVPRKSRSDPMQRTYVGTDGSDFWNESEDCKTFTIQLLNTKSSIDILWRPCYWH